MVDNKAYYYSLLIPTTKKWYTLLVSLSHNACIVKTQHPWKTGIDFLSVKLFNIKTNLLITVTVNMKVWTLMYLFKKETNFAVANIFFLNHCY